jgi:7-carboxy-7-deazaguanine synthase
LGKGYEVLVETNGSMNIQEIDKRATVILDIKTPDSGMSGKMDFTNLEHIKNSDEVKFVLCSRDDYEWAKEIISRYRLEERCKVLFSPAFGLLHPGELASWILADRLRVRLNIQIHKYIFHPGERWFEWSLILKKVRISFQMPAEYFFAKVRPDLCHIPKCNLLYLIFVK